jgi:O-methyltransferase involved in polyketide biosynthesis
MQKDTASKSAITTAVMRAAHQILDEDPKILEDPIAVGLVPGSSEEEIRRREEEFKQHPNRSIFPLRSRFTEDQLADAFRNGVRQYVILGAGFDTFAY